MKILHGRKVGIKSVFSAIVALVGLPVISVSIAAPAAYADNLGYPNSTMQCVHAPYSTDGSGYWCPGYSWGTIRNNDDYASILSNRGYAYRNCTDYVAWKLQSLGVPDGKTRGLGNGGDWYANAPSNGLSRGSTPAVGAAAIVPSTTPGYNGYGHVAYVEAVNGDGTITISEYNYNLDGKGWRRTGTPAAMHFTQFVYFAGLMTNPPSGSSTASSYGLPTPGAGSKVALARQADGRLVVFCIGTNSAIYYSTQQWAGSPYWSEMHYLPAYAKAIAAVTNREGKIELFMVGGNDALYHHWQTVANSDQWSAAEYFPANIRAVSAVNNANGIITVTAVGPDNNLYMMQQTAPSQWNGQWNLKPSGSTDVAMAASSDGRAELFHIGTNQYLYHRWEASPGCCWSGDEYYPAGITKVAATRNADGRLEVFAIGTNAQVYNKWQQQPGTNWYGDWGLIPAQARYIAASTNTDGRLAIFVVGANSQLYINEQNSPGCCWGGWRHIPATVAP